MSLWEPLWSSHYPEILRLIRPDTACQAVFLLNFGFRSCFLLLWVGQCSLVFSKSVQLSLFDFSMEVTIMGRIKKGKALLEGRG